MQLHQLGLQLQRLPEATRQHATRLGTRVGELRNVTTVHEDEARRFLAAENEFGEIFQRDLRATRSRSERFLRERRQIRELPVLVTNTREAELRRPRYRCPTHGQQPFGATRTVLQPLELLEIDLEPLAFFDLWGHFPSPLPVIYRLHFTAASAGARSPAHA
jgi:hypothetical protein